MKLTDQIQTILDQEMDRKKFLQVAGAAALGIIGITKILQSLGALTQKQAEQKQPAGYGSTPYGL